MYDPYTKHARDQLAQPAPAPAAASYGCAILRRDKSGWVVGSTKWSRQEALHIQQCCEYEDGNAARVVFATDVAAPANTRPARAEDR